MDLIFSLLQQMCVYLVLAYMLSKTPIFLPLLSISSHPFHKFSCYLIFSLFCILGTYFGLGIDDAIANTRAIGAVMGGIFGGPVVGFAVGLTGGLHRYSLGGFTDLACAISTTFEGLTAGLLHLYLIRRNKTELLFNPAVILIITLFVEIGQMLIILSVAKPYDQALLLVSQIAAPMIITNCVGAALFISILQDKKTIYENYSATFSRKALTIAERTVGILGAGLNTNSAQKIVKIIYEETNVGAVAITDKHKILAFVGIGDAHHLPNTPISSQSTLKAIDEDRVIYLDGRAYPYQCSISTDCKLGSALIIPLRSGKEVIGTIKLYEPKRKLFTTINRSMGRGIAQLLSSQILHGEYLQQQGLLAQSEIKLLHAQVNPHFLFNTLNTISAVIRNDPDKARELIQHLSHFFRSNLKKNINKVTFKEELAHVNAYLTIEQARFADRLTVKIDIHDALLNKTLPSFTLQPLVENAIKHGISNLFENGVVNIYSKRCKNGYKVTVRDNAGSFVQPVSDHTGLGMGIVNKRLMNAFGENSELVIECEKDKFTQMSFILPDD